MANRIIRSNFTGGEVTPEFFGREDISRYNNSLEICKNFVPQVYGGLKSRPGTKFVVDGDVSTLLDVANSDDVRLIPFTFNTTQSYILVFGNLRMAVIKDGALATIPLPGGGEQILIISTPYSADKVQELRFTQIFDTMYISHPAVAPYKLQRAGHTSWIFTAVSASRPAAPANLTVGFFPAHTPGASVVSYEYGVTCVSENGAESSLTLITQNVDAVWPSGIGVLLQWDKNASVDFYRVYKRRYNSTWGLIAEPSQSYTRLIEFLDDNINPGTQGPPEQNNPITTASNYPTAVGLFEQRMFYGGSDNQPQTVHGSQTALLENFDYTSPSLDTDALEYTLFSAMSERILHFVPMEKLLVFTSESEKILDHGANSDALTPTSVYVRTRSRFGSCNVPPVVIGNEVLFVPRDGVSIRNMFYSLEQDGYDTDNLALFAAHIFDSQKIAGWAYQEDREVLWVITNTGELLSLTYNKKQQVWAWARHVTDGIVKSIASINTSNGSEVYIDVLRWIYTSSLFVHRLEKLHEGDRSSPETSFCVDSGVEFVMTPPGTSISVPHLAGRTVDILADGAVYKNITLSLTGTHTLPVAASKVIVGLPFICEFRPVRLSVPLGGTTIQGMYKSINRVTIRTKNTRGLSVQNPNGDSVDLKPRGHELYGSPSSLVTGDTLVITKDFYNTDGQILVRQTNPLPAHVIALMMEVELED